MVCECTFVCAWGGGLNQGGLNGGGGVKSGGGGVKSGGGVTKKIQENLQG